MNPPKPKGLYCPQCRGVRLTVVKTVLPCPGVRIRYRKCSTCNAKIKTTETVNRAET